MRHRNVYRGLALTLAVAVAVALWLSDRSSTRPGPPAGGRGARPDQPFTELSAAVATEIKDGWTVAVPPRRTGPYRRSPENAQILSRGAGDQEVICRVRGGPQDEPEEIRLKAVPDADQMVVFLDTADGKRTAVVLRRTR